MPRTRKTKKVGVGIKATLRSPFYHKYKLDDVKGKNVIKLVTLDANSSVTEYPAHIQGIWKNRKKRKGGMPFKIVKLSNGIWIPLSQIKIMRDNEYGIADNKDEKQTEHIEETNMKARKATTTKTKLIEHIKKLVKMEIKKQLNESKIPNFIPGSKAHLQLGDGYGDGLDITELDKTSNEFKFKVGEQYKWDGVLDDEKLGDPASILCLGFYHGKSYNSSMAYFLILSGIDKGKFMGFWPNDQDHIK